MAKPSIKIHKKGQTKHIIEGLQHRHEGGFHHSNVPPAVEGGAGMLKIWFFSGRYQKHLEECEEKQVMLVIYIMDISGITHQIINITQYYSILLNITQYYSILLNITQYYSILLNITQYYSIFPKK